MSLCGEQDTLLAEAQPLDVDVRYGVHSQRGARPTMEDEHLCVLDISEGTTRHFEEAGAKAFFGVRPSCSSTWMRASCLRLGSAIVQGPASSLPQVFDGHGGKSAANFAKAHLLERLMLDATFPTRIPEAMVCLPCPMCFPENAGRAERQASFLYICKV